MKTAPIALFVYNRLSKTKETVSALRKNIHASDSRLYIYSDGPKSDEDERKVNEVREYLETIDGFSGIERIYKSGNHGLADSVIAGVTQVMDKHGRAIVLEDDLITSPYFLKYMNEALEFYRERHDIFSISGYGLSPKVLKISEKYLDDIYLNYRNSSWGWGAWKDRWIKADWDVLDYGAFKNDRKERRLFNRGGDDMSEMLDAQMRGTIDSWAIRWSYAHYKNNAFSVCPVYSYVSNIGHDGSGVHCRKEDAANIAVDINLAKKDIVYIRDIKINQDMMRKFRKALKPSLFFRIKRKIKEVLKINEDPSH